MVSLKSLLSVGILLLGQVLLSSCKQLQLEDAEPFPSRSRSPAQDTTIRMSIGLTSRDKSLLENTLYEISDPLHRRYGKHLSQAEAAQLLLPDDDALSSVKRWLAESGVPDESLHVKGQFIDAVIPTSMAQSLVGNNFMSLNRDGGGYLMPSQEHLPPLVRRHIQTFQLNIHPERSNINHNVVKQKSSKSMSHPKKPAKGNWDLDRCKVALTPACLREIYQIGNTYADPTLNTKFGVVGFDGVSCFFSPSPVNANNDFDTANSATGSTEEVFRPIR